MSNEQNMIKCAVRALLKLAEENEQLKRQQEKTASQQRALGIARRLAELGTITPDEVFEKAAALEGRNLDLVEEAIKLDLPQTLSLGTAAITKEAEALGQDIGRTSFEDFIINNYT